MKKTILSLLLALAATVTMQAQDEYSTLVVETKSGKTLELSLKQKPSVSVSDKEFTITCGDEVTGYVHDEVRKFYFKPYDPAGIDEPVAEDVIRVLYLDQSKVVVSGIDKAKQVNLYTLDGRKVAARAVQEEGKLTVSLDGLAPGTYILNIGNVQSFKLQKR